MLKFQCKELSIRRPNRLEPVVVSNYSGEQMRGLHNAKEILSGLGVYT